MPDLLCERCKDPGHVEPYQLVAYLTADLCHRCFRAWVLFYTGDPRGDRIEILLEKLAFAKGRLAGIAASSGTVLSRAQDKFLKDLVTKLRRERLSLMKTCQKWISEPVAIPLPPQVGFGANRKPAKESP